MASTFSCNTGAPQRDLSVNSLCAQKATVGSIVGQTGSFNVISANVTHLPEKTVVFANGSTLATPNVIVLNVLELSEVYDAEAAVLHTWPNTFNPSGNTGFQISIGGLFYSAGTTTTGTYFQWTNVNVQNSGVYAFRAVAQTGSGNGKYTLYVDGVSTGLTHDLSTSLGTQYNVYNWTGFELSKGLHDIRLQCTAIGTTGGHCDYGGTEQPFLLVQIQ